MDCSFTPAKGHPHWRKDTPQRFVNKTGCKKSRRLSTWAATATNPRQIETGRVWSSAHVEPHWHFVCWAKSQSGFGTPGPFNADLKWKTHFQLNCWTALSASGVKLHAVSNFMEKHISKLVPAFNDDYYDNWLINGVLANLIQYTTYRSTLLTDEYVHHYLRIAFPIKVSVQ